MATPRTATHVDIEVEVSHADRDAATSLLAETLAARILALAETAETRPVTIEFLTIGLQQAPQSDGIGHWTRRTKISVTLATAPRTRRQIIWSALRRMIGWLTATLRTTRLSLIGGVELVIAADADPAVTNDIVDLGQAVLERVTHKLPKRL